MTDETNETQQTFEYQQPDAPSTADAQIKQAEQSRTSSPEDMVTAKERKAFEVYVKNQGLEIPKNFKDSNAWFDSLKSAQKEYTKARQEIAELKKTYEKDGTKNPTYVEETVSEESEKVAEEPKINVPEELRIPEIKKEEVINKEPVKQVITEEDWSKWSMEVALSNDLSKDTIEEIKEKTGFTDRIISDYVEGQRAKSREAFGKAAEVVGGKDRLANIFAWAAKTMTPQQQADINASLASPSWDVALLGLQVKYDKATANSAKGKELPKNKQVNVSATKVPLSPYKTKREFYADRGNPRYNSDAKFRQAVEQRIMMTDITRLPN